MCFIYLFCFDCLIFILAGILVFGSVVWCVRDFAKFSVIISSNILFFFSSYGIVIIHVLDSLLFFHSSWFLCSDFLTHISLCVSAWIISIHLSQSLLSLTVISLLTCLSKACHLSYYMFDFLYFN